MMKLNELNCIDRGKCAGISRRQNGEKSGDRAEEIGEYCSCGLISAWWE